MSEQLHTGHRERMRRRIQEAGIGKLEEHEVLEYLLYSFVPRKDTNALAHRLIDEFGSLCDVMNTDPIHLQKVSGMTENASLFLSSLPEVFRHYVISAKSRKRTVVLDSPAKVNEFLGTNFIGLDEERVYAVALDINDRVVADKEWTSGKRARVEISPSQISDFVSRTKAVSVLIAHNHPGGTVSPSFADINLTRDIWQMLRIMKYELRDHMIFNDAGEFYSFKQNGYLEKWQRGEY